MTKEPKTSELADHAFECWMLNNVYDLVWEAEFKTLITPDLIAFKFDLEPIPFGRPFKSRVARVKLEEGDGSDWISAKFASREWISRTKTLIQRTIRFSRYKVSPEHERYHCGSVVHSIRKLA